MINSFINTDKLIVDAQCKEQLILLYNKYINHKFNLLGSEWVNVDYSMKAKGFRGIRYKSNSMAAFKTIFSVKKNSYKISEDYEPINWFIDYKSGFFFNPFFYNTIKKCISIIGNKPGVDIKCPWELGRFYHLPQLAVLAAVDNTYSDRIIIEFKDEIQDFIIMNPIGKTVQWSAIMDTSIRTVNLLIAYDILNSIENNKEFDDEFNKLFEKLINDSLELIMNNLEYSSRLNSNHYLSNLAGIIFAAAYLSENEWTDGCLVFGVQELINEVISQFGDDGGHYEGSTSYHRLSYEFVLYPTALIYGVLDTKRKKVFCEYKSNTVKRLKKFNLQKYDINTAILFPKEYIDKLYNAAIFTKYMIKSNNEIVQIGDNDSGRLLKLTPMLNIEMSDNENILDHRTVLSAANGLFENDNLNAYGSLVPLEKSFVMSLNNFKIKEFNEYDSKLEFFRVLENKELKYRKKTVLYIDNKNESLLDGLSINYFNKFGVLVVKSKRIDLFMVIDTTTKLGGHTHNDKLSIELIVDEKYITRDPGGYIYTSAPDLRNKFRSVKAHNTIHCDDIEQNIFNGTFGIYKRAHSKLISYTKNSFSAECRYGHVIHLRRIDISDHKILVFDYANVPFKVGFDNKKYSIGYGKLGG